MQGKTVVITGATNGIGRATAHALAARGAQVVAVGRNPTKGQATVEAIQQETGNHAIVFETADLSSQADVRRLASRVADQHDRIDVLINNAGGLFGSRMESADGIEMTFALNHLGPFLLTNLLLDRLRATAGARVVNVASRAHVGATLDFDDLQFGSRYKGLAAYQRSKLCNILFTYELARRLGDSGPAVNALHPGFVRTHLGQGAADNSLFWRAATSLVFRFGGAIDVRKGVETSIMLASSADVTGVTGKYFSGGRETQSSSLSHDTEVAGHLWKVSATLAPF